MSYRCGIGHGLMAVGMEPRSPHVLCDGCGATQSAITSHGLPTRWMQAGRTAPGWKMLRTGDGSKRWDLCKLCLNTGKPLSFGPGGIVGSWFGESEDE